MSVRRWTGTGGTSIVELVLIVSLLGIILVMVLPAFNSKPQNIAADVQDLANYLAVAREMGISRTQHYRIRVFSTGPPYQYAMERYNGTAWVTERTITLRSGVVFPGATLGLIAEFDTRGMLVTGAPPVFTLQNPAGKWVHTVTVNGVGMVDHT
ncbi:MAG TPA: hypothetical protein VGA35_09950 [bacterium]